LALTIAAQSSTTAASLKANQKNNLNESIYYQAILLGGQCIVEINVVVCNILSEIKTIRGLAMKITSSISELLIK
jgi:hypothetical protein